MRSNTILLLLIVISSLASGLACSGQDVYGLTREGSQMTPAEKVSLEEQVAKNPEDVESRIKLLGYYFIKGRQDPDAMTARERHILWLIENAPESKVLGLPYGQLDKILEPEAYGRAKQAWQAAIKASPGKLLILKNASAFFLLHDSALSEELLLKGESLDAKDPHWHTSLAQLYSLELSSLPAGPEQKATAEKAFRQYKLGYDLSSAIEKDAFLPNLAQSAIAAGHTDDAKKFAEQMLDDNADGWNRGNRIHHGNLILGRIALSAGNIDEAKSRLLSAGKTSGSPQLNSFGPNMLLAKELLERGETEVVLEYFELCKKFWSLQRGKLKQWADEVKANRIPEFGGNLSY